MCTRTKGISFMCRLTLKGCVWGGLESGKSGVNETDYCTDVPEVLAHWNGRGMLTNKMPLVWIRVHRTINLEIIKPYGPLKIIFNKSVSADTSIKWKASMLITFSCHQFVSCGNV